MDSEDIARNVIKKGAGSWIQGVKKQRIPDPGSGSAKLRVTIIFLFYDICISYKCSLDWRRRQEKIEFATERPMEACVTGEATVFFMIF
jgi:hypothetical protein